MQDGQPIPSLVALTTCDYIQSSQGPETHS